MWGYGAVTNKETETKRSAGFATQRRQAVQDAVSAGPQLNTWQTAEGTAISVAIPRPSASGRFVDVKKCIVWRDAVTKNASLHCDRDELDLDNQSTEKPDVADPR